jgi:fimbrial chaperone protein/chaperone protein EcpD
MWLDDGNAATPPEEAVTPFNLTPPVAKLKADSSQIVRLVYTGEPLPADRESVFYFNMLEVPQKSNEQTKISFAVRTRIKVFFRPKALKGELADQLDKVTWNLVKKDGNWVAEGTNPSVFHFSFFSLNLGSDGKFNISTEGGMIPPKSSASFVVGAVDKITQPLTTIRVEFINDYGGAIPKEFPISAGN